MADFDYDAPAEVYMTSPWGAKNRPVTYRRFDRSAEAIRFAIEELPEPMQRGVAMEIGDDRFEFADILELYARAIPISPSPNVLVPVQRPVTAVGQR